MSNTLYKILGAILIIVSLVLVGVIVYYAIKKTKLTTVKKVLFYGGAAVSMIAGLILVGLGFKKT